MSDNTKNALITLAKGVATCILVFIGSLLGNKSGDPSIAYVATALGSSVFMA